MKYTALTLGPIAASLMQARKTREIWAASFLLSKLMEDIIGHLLKNGVPENQFILPYPKVRELRAYTDQLKCAGVYPDHLILKSETGLFDKLQAAVDSAVENLANDFKDTLKETDSIDYLKKYLRTDIVEFEPDSNSAPDQKENIIFKTNNYLANCELQKKLIAKDELLFTGYLEKIAESALFKDVFGKRYSYPSILEIGIRKIKDGSDIPKGEIEALQKEGEAALIKEGKNSNNPKKWDDDDKLLAGLKKSPDFKDKLKTAHKYIAIVQADGDNVGELIKSIYENNKEKIGAFSKALSTFSLKATETVVEYGGEPVYSGGDDLLFFAPVVTYNSNIVNLLLSIDGIFKKEINENADLSALVANLKKQPSMSYGLSVTYYKYPMHEALKAAVDLLFGKAKKANNETKNAIAYRLQKHSGQSFDDVLFKNSDFFGKFAKMLEVENLNLISSLLYNLERQKSSLQKIVSDSNRLKAFFDNTYNEDVHTKDKTAEAFIKNVQELLQFAYCQNNDIDAALIKVYSALRFVKFLNRKHHD